MRHEFEVIRLWEQDYSDFLDCPGLLPLAVLGRRDNRARTLQFVSSVIDNIEDRRQRLLDFSSGDDLSAWLAQKEI